MASAKVRTSSSPVWFVSLLIVVGLVIVGIAGLVIYLTAGGEVRVPFTDPQRTLSLGKKEEVRPWSPPEGKVAVLVAARRIEAYTKVSRDDLFNPKTGSLTVAWVDPAGVGNSITDFGKIVGRVLERAKNPDYAFTESDFLPVGTRPGLVGGIPPGMRAMRIDLTKVRGFYGLLPGDHFDLVATMPATGDPSAELKKLGGVQGDRMAMEASLSNLGKQATVRVLVQNGIVVNPVETVEIPTSSASMTGKGAHTRPVQEVVIALLPEEVARVAEALAVDAELSVVPRSGRPEDPKDSVTPELHPKNPFAVGEGQSGGTTLRFVETIGSGGQRGVVPVPSGGDAKEDAPRAK